MLKSLVLLGVAFTAAHAHFSVLEKRDGPPDGFSRVGPSPANKILNLRLALAQNDISGLHDTVYDVSTPGNPRYGQYLSKEEVEKFVAPSPDTVTQVNSWLTSNNLTALPLTGAGDWIAVDMTVSQANKLLATEFSTFQNPNTNLTVDRTLSYSIPSSLKAKINTVYPTVTFPVGGNRFPPAVNTTSPTPGSSHPTTSISSDCRVNNSWSPPACLQELYDIPSAPASPAANVLAVSGFINDFANKRDLKAFLSEFRPDMNPNTSFDFVSVNGGINNQLPAGAGFGPAIEIEYTVGLATGVSVEFISTGPRANDFDYLTAFLNQANYLISLASPPQTVLHTYADTESDIALSPQIAESICNAYAQLAARGVSYIVDTGVLGSGGSPFNEECIPWDPPFPATCPFVTAVGATEFLPAETQESGATASGGGFSNIFERPKYQDTTVSAYLKAVGADASSPFNISGRAVPDVSAIAQAPFFLQGFFENRTEHTAFSASIFASVVALLTNERLSAGKHALGFLNPLIYLHAGAFTDISTGFNGGNGCSPLGFNATAGWDPVTGVGSPSYTKLQEVCTEL
ncbi:Serine protease S53 [Mycena venus]|uniref:Serine protease S53 n=1 Tax=Mycena venus TaxID=2733690 RepID=A0A8H6XKL5_9AGAR|nr:Serine protease S53 [Mycena venus]